MQLMIRYWDKTRMEGIRETGTAWEYNGSLYLATRTEDGQTHTQCDGVAYIPFIYDSLNVVLVTIDFGVCIEDYVRYNRTTSKYLINREN